MADTSPLVIDPPTLRRILASAPGSILVYDLDLRVRFLNRFEPQYRPEEVIGADFSVFHTPEEAQRLRQLFEDVRQRGGVQELVSAVEHRDGTRHWYATRVAPLKNEHGVLLGFVMMANEITAQKRVELELEKTQGRLADASQRADRAEMATGVLHNVGNVVNSVNVSAATLRQELSSSHVDMLARTVKLCEEHGEALPAFLAHDPRGQRVMALLGRVTQQIVDERRRLRAEVQRMIEHVSIIRSTVEVQQAMAKTGTSLEEIAPQQLVEQTLSMVRLDLESTRVHVEVQAEAGLRLQLDRLATQQILLGLVRNAIDALREVEGPRTLHIRIHAGDGRVSFEVEDNGCGITAENLAAIFRRGYTARKTGHGFGLHASVVAARAMGGSLTVESGGPGQGARFCLSLPQQPPRAASA